MKNSPNWKKIILTLSLSINLIFFLLFSLIIYKKGGSSYLIKRTKSIFVENKKAASAFKSKSPLNRQTPSCYDKISLFNSHKRSLFEVLPDTKNEIIFLGDSITEGCRWTELFQSVNIKNRGIGGDRTDDILPRLHEVVSSSPDKVFLMIGINDLASGVGVREIVLNYEKIIHKISEKSPRTKIYIQSVLPLNESLLSQYFPKSNLKSKNIIKLNHHLKDLSVKYQLTYIDLYTLFKKNGKQLDENFTYDGLHLNGKAYWIWKSAIEKFVRP